MKKHFQLSTLNCKLIIAMAMMSMVSCDVAKQARGAYNMVHCKYEYHSLTNLSVAGINVSKGISLLDAPKIITLFSGNAVSLPIGFTVNLDVTNPNPTEAMLSGLEYILSIDGIDFTTGSIEQAMAIPAGGTGMLPLGLAFDVATLLKGESRDAVVGIVKNLAGMGSEPSKVTLGIRPSFNVAGYKVTSPVYIPVSFSFGGK